MRRFVGQIGRRRAGARAVDKHKAQIESNVFHQFQRLLEFGLGFARKADDEVGTQTQIWADGAQLADNRFVFQRGIAAFHRAQYAVGTTLDRQMQVRNQLGQIAVAFDNRIGKLARVAGGKPHAFDAGNFVHDAQQSGEVADFTVVGQTAVGVDVLPQQIDFFYALLRQIGDFGQHVA